MAQQRSAQEYGRVAVLLGGDSAEREISLISGKAVLRALQAAGVDAVGIDPGPDLSAQLREAEAERVFIMLHGGRGEDGTVQALLELLGLPYTGSGVLGSALGMDKVRCKKVWLADGLPTPPFALLDEHSDWEAIIARLGTVFVKPVREGSSIGVSRAATATELAQAYAAARTFDSEVIAERFIQGSEFSVPVVDGEVLPVIEMRPAVDFYDYQAKYFSDDTRYLCPAPLSEAMTREIQDLALRAYEAVGCSGWGRVDVMQDGEGHFWLLEVNTVPGMTEHSLVPMSAAAAGLSFTQLVLRILDSSWRRASER